MVLRDRLGMNNHASNIEIAQVWNNIIDKLKGKMSKRVSSFACKELDVRC